MDAKARKSVVIVGSAGYIGRRLVEALSQKNYTVVSVYNRHLPESLPKVVPLCCNLMEEESIKAALKHADVVVHAGWSSAPSQTTHRSKKGPSANEQMTANLVHAMQKVGSKRLIFLSSASTSRFANTAFLREKYYCESLLINSTIKEKMIVRCGIVLDKKFDGNLFLTGLRGMMRLPLVYPLPEVTDGVSVTYLHELVNLIVDMVEWQKPLPECSLFEAVSAANVAIPNLMKLIREKEHLGFKLPIRGGIGRLLWTILDKRKDERATASVLDLIRSGVAHRPQLTNAEFWKDSNVSVQEMFSRA